MQKMPLKHIKEKYPEEWVLLGSPEIKDNEVLGGFLLFHAKDKKSVLDFARQEIYRHPMIKVVFTGEPSKAIRFNIFKVTETPA